MPDGIFTCSHITFGMVYSFYFLCFGSRRNELNSFWDRDEEWDRRLWLIPMLFPLCWTFFQVSLMIIWYRNLSLYMMNLSLYCRNISLFSKHTPYVTIKAISLLFLENDNPLYFYCSLKREKIIFCPLPPSLPQRLLAFIPSGAKTQKKEIIPYPRCGFGACLRCGQVS